MWIGELISQRGIGNGMSMVIFASVVSRLPFGYYAILQEQKWFAFGLLVVVSLLIVVAVVRVELAQRRIPVQFAKRVVGRRMYGVMAMTATKMAPGSVMRLTAFDR